MNHLAQHTKFINSSSQNALASTKIEELLWSNYFLKLEISLQYKSKKDYSKQQYHLFMCITLEARGEKRENPNSIFIQNITVFLNYKLQVQIHYFIWDYENRIT